MKRKSVFVCALLALATLGGVQAANGQNKRKPPTMEEKMKRPSPPVTVSGTLKSGAVITIDYSQPSLKGRVPGKDIEPFENKVWRAGANEATTFTTTQNVKIERKILPAGKYAFFTLKNGNTWTLIFNKVWDTWGAFSYEKDKAEDILHVNVTEKTAKASAEKLTYEISPKGIVTLLWGNYIVSFKVK